MTDQPPAFTSVARRLEALADVIPDFGVPIPTYDRLSELTRNRAREDASLPAPDYLLTVLQAFERVSQEILGVEYLYIVRSRECDPLCVLRDEVAAARVLPGITRWPTDAELHSGLLLLLISGFVYDFPLAHRFCRAPGDLLKRQTRVAGWGVRYYQDRLAARPALRVLYDMADRFFRDGLGPLGAHVEAASMITSKRRLADTVGWIAP